MATITRHMNARLRTRGYSAKEIAFQRDQVSNESKIVSDQKLAEDHVKKLFLKHPSSGLAQALSEFKVGDVFLKNDKNKLRGREMYKIAEAFDFNNEKWAKLQKTENQFRAKQYDAKLPEIILIPGQHPNDVLDGQKEKDRLNTEKENHIGDENKNSMDTIAKQLKKKLERKCLTRLKV